MTPEGRVKAKVDALLKAARAYKHKPVQNGMGSPALDYHVCHFGYYLGIETKAADKWPTPRQTITMQEVIKAQGALFLIRNDEDVKELEVWLCLPTLGYISKTALQWMGTKTPSARPSSDE